MKLPIQFDLPIQRLLFLCLLQQGGCLFLPAEKGVLIQNRPTDCFFHIPPKRADLFSVSLSQQQHHMYHFRDWAGYVSGQIVAGATLADDHAGMLQHSQSLSGRVSPDRQRFRKTAFCRQPRTNSQFSAGDHLGQIRDHFLILSGFFLHKPPHMICEKIVAPITVIKPATTMDRLLIAPSTSPSSIAFAVPMAWEAVPNAMPFATGS